MLCYGTVSIRTVVLPSPSVATPDKVNATAKANVSDMEQIEKLQEGLKSIQKAATLLGDVIGFRDRKMALK